MENNSLACALFGPEEYQLQLDWPTRHKICVCIARGLAYLHEESTLKIVHRDIKATNVLLDQDLIPRISDFGLARLGEEEKTHISTCVAGTMKDKWSSTLHVSLWQLLWSCGLCKRKRPSNSHCPPEGVHVLTSSDGLNPLVVDDRALATDVLPLEVIELPHSYLFPVPWKL
ncbi:probable LRR receptor-like serine/threonine-protein kinase At1g53420 [Magnolia sinica]|uniref:probable LRR receptor-like serine/threonine-protein kinase At1g53420 n=1 Tax=Magnolia sinica TaxID=86752 RepID=UPI002658171D|nr:probable LRR receptor-like serine/threonine-protein kinase At1g53420 [Magnolia sinica]